MRKLFKGGNYSRAETIRGNTVGIYKTMYSFRGILLIPSRKRMIFKIQNSLIDRDPLFFRFGRILDFDLRIDNCRIKLWQYFGFVDC